MHICESDVFYIYLFIHNIIMVDKALVDRVKKIIELKGLNPSYFADHIGISRSSLNHVLNGRNNPSLELVKKIREKYPDISYDWLISESGPMSCLERQIIYPLFDMDESVPEKKATKSESKEEIALKPPAETVKPPDLDGIITEKKVGKRILKTIILYSDNTFESLSPDKKTFDE